MYGSGGSAPLRHYQKNALSTNNQTIQKSSIMISSISTWEIALLVEKGRLKLSIDTRDWVRKTEGLNFVRFIPVENTIALRSVSLQGNSMLPQWIGSSQHSFNHGNPISYKQ